MNATAEHFAMLCSKRHLHVRMHQMQVPPMPSGTTLSLSMSPARTRRRGPDYETP